MTVTLTVQSFIVGAVAVFALPTAGALLVAAANALDRRQNARIVAASVLVGYVFGGHLYDAGGNPFVLAITGVLFGACIAATLTVVSHGLQADERRLVAGGVGLCLSLLVTIVVI